MRRNKWEDMGKEFKENFKNTKYNKDFQKMYTEIGNNVNNTLDKAFEEVRKAVSSIQIETFNNRSSVQTGKNHSENKQRQAEKKQYENQHTSNRNNNQSPWQQKQKPRESFPHVSVGKVAGILYTVFGSIGIGVLGTAIIVLMIIGVKIPILDVFASIIEGLLVVLLAGSIGMAIRGAVIRKRLKRFKRYLRFLKGRNSCMIKELSSYFGFSKRFIIKDFRKMIMIGMFPQGHIDEEKTMIMLNRESYDNYLEQQAAFKTRQLEQEEKLANSKRVNETETHEKSEVMIVIAEGKQYIRTINEIQKAIYDREVSNKVSRMEHIIDKIMTYISEHPEQISEVKRLIEYYLPTTIKLLDAYREFDSQTIQGENITTGKNEIKNALDTINLAFENLLDSLFENAAWDVSTDISVLQTMLAQEGLTEKDFDLDKQKEE